MRTAFRELTNKALTHFIIGSALGQLAVVVQFDGPRGERHNHVASPAGETVDFVIALACGGQRECSK